MNLPLVFSMDPNSVLSLVPWFWAYTLFTSPRRLPFTGGVFA